MPSKKNNKAREARETNATNATNATDTTFASRCTISALSAIVVNQPSLHPQAPSSSILISHHISRLASLNQLWRRQGLAYLLSVLRSPRRDEDLIRQIVPKVLELTLDVSNDVRMQAINVLRQLSRQQAEEHVEQMLPFIRSGLTHLAANIASTSLDILKWLTETCGERLVSCRGGWVKTLKCFLVMLRWSAESRTSGWVFSRSSIGDTTYQGVSLAKCLEVLGIFLRTGLMRPRENRVPPLDFPTFPISGTLGAYLPMGGTGGFSCLDLFGEALDTADAECNDVDTRQQVIFKIFQPALEQGLAALLRDGGQVGRAAGETAEILRQGLRNCLGPEGHGSDEETGDITDTDGGAFGAEGVQDDRIQPDNATKDDLEGEAMGS